jgi:hypothetical protein
MSWTPRFAFLPFTVLREKVRAVIERDLPAALAWIQEEYGAELPALDGIYSARAVRDQRIFVNLLSGPGDPQEDQDGDYDELRRLIVEVERVGRKPDDLAEELELVVTALRTVLCTVPDTEWTDAWASDTRADFRVTIGQERYGERFYDSENLYAQVGSIILTITYREAEIVP